MDLSIRSIKVAVRVIISLILFSISFFLLVVIWSGAGARPGFLGTSASFIADTNLVAQFALLIGLSVGAVMAHRGRIQAHQTIQTSMVLLNILLAVFIMNVSFARKVVPGLPGNLITTYGLVSSLHAMLGGLAILCGVYLLLRMNRLLPVRWRISWWKTLMRVTLGLYWTAGIMGLVLYRVWYFK